MKYLKRNIEFLLACLGFIVIFFFYSFCSGMDDKLLLGLLGTVATLYFGSIKNRIENDKLFKELFQGFNEKYDSRFNDLINELKYNKAKELELPDVKLIIDYLNLCSEEFLWRSRNRIPSKVWKAWKAGIKENLKIEQVKEIYIKETSTINGKVSYYGLIEELEK